MPFGDISDSYAPRIYKLKDNSNTTVTTTNVNTNSNIKNNNIANDETKAMAEKLAPRGSIQWLMLC